MHDLSTWAVVANTAGAVAVVVLFLRFLQGEREARERLEEHRDEALAKIGDACHEHSARLLNQAGEIATGCARSLEKNTEALARVEHALDRLNS